MEGRLLSLFIPTEVSVVTEAQKNNVLLLRQKGYGYKEIATELDVNVNTVRSFCSRNGLLDHNAYKDTGNKENKETTNFDNCHQCGKSLKQRPKTKRRRFCCDACRHRWWNAHRDKVNSKTTVRTVCACCGLLFDSYAYQRRKYCSHACYVKRRYGGDAA